uniref:polyphenol oxidase I, chloroplastic-like n=1 Tax=Erigeron canadensis TaxID=72917 RepID=UPI001CB8C75F|nr:polyphenol oxidase I, chloroplastic-like [Erigeron canadensis]
MMTSLPTPTVVVAKYTAVTTTSPVVSSWPNMFPMTKGSLFKLPRQSNGKMISCNASSDKENDQKPMIESSFDRRDMLLGLGGLVGVASLTSARSVGAAPLAAPDISKCGNNPLSGFTPGENTPQGDDCCPPDSPQILDFEFPKEQPLRVRPAAHLMSPSYIAKFQEAVKRMKELPKDDPRSFFQQAQVHCAYCNGSYTQSSSGFPDVEIQIHNSWIFYPFHRWYLYFYERILGSLIDDPTFGLPFWNWDTPAGMRIPSYFNDPNSSLFDSKRNQDHLNAVIDLGYHASNTDTPEQDTVSNNLAIMYRQMVTNATDPISFFGGEYRAGTEPIDGGGSIEQIPHIPIHVWVGDPRETNGEDMGNLYSSGRDPLFYCHHCNVDRMWSLWKMLDGKNVDITDTDWLNTSFVFYDENKNLVRVYVKDCLLTNKLGYDYQKVDVPWVSTKPVPRAPKSGIAKKMTGKIKNTNDTSFPIKLDKIVKLLVSRPKKSRSKKEKKEHQELLVLYGIKYDSQIYVKFDVFVNDEDDNSSSPSQTEYAGSFAQLPHKHKGKSRSKTSFRAGMTELLDELQADDDDSVLVTLIPRTGCDDVTIDGIKIIYV